ncbi:MAG: hypothetical protein Q8R82_18730 [Hyphomonadaceae bacterium]|nr:hypothetical protein [Hyphomonadaceae bacterium]
MTAYSLRILELPSGVSQDALEKSTLDAPTAQALSLFAEQCGPYGLSDWAKPRGHSLYYVDNCWVRARVYGRDIPAFFADVLGGEPQLAPRIEPDREYLIEAEEF